MPYLDGEFKNEIQEEEDLQQQQFYGASLPLDKFLGYLNYKNYAQIKFWVKVNGKKYAAFAGFIGTLICCVLEVYRRLVAPYEDEKINDPNNGDIDV